LLGPLAVLAFPTRRSSDLLGAAISWAAGTVYTKHRGLPGDPLGLAAWQLGIGAAVAGLGALAFEVPRVDFTDPIVGGAFVYHVVDRKSTRLNSSHVKIPYA